MTDFLCGGMIPIELSSSTQIVTIPCPPRELCLRYSEKVKLPVALYYNRIERNCKSFIGKN